MYCPPIQLELSFNARIISSNVLTLYEHFTQVRIVLPIIQTAVNRTSDSEQYQVC